MDRTARFGMVLGAFLFGVGTGAAAWAQTPDLPDPAAGASTASSPSTTGTAPAPAPAATTPATTTAPPASTTAPTDTGQAQPVDNGPTVRSTFDEQDLEPDHPTGNNDNPGVGSSFDREDKVDEHPVP